VVEVVLVVLVRIMDQTKLLVVVVNLSLISLDLFLLLLFPQDQHGLLL
jgi:hypothetical protein